MSEHEPILDRLRQQAAADARARVMGYIALELRHTSPGGMTGDDEMPEGKNG